MNISRIFDYIKNHKILTVIACVLILFPCFLSAQSENDFTVTVNDAKDGVIITAYTGKAAQVRIPPVIKGLPVKEIGDGAFYWTSITSVIIPNGVTVIGERAFSVCFALVSVSIPEGVTTIGDRSFSHCQRLSAVTLPQSLTSIGSNAFSYCWSLSSVTFKTTSLASIPNGTFWNCNTLAKLIIPEGVTIIGEGAFADCELLTSVSLPSTIKTIELDAFSRCQSLTTISIPDSVTSVSFGERVFYNCRKLDAASVSALKRLGYKE
jgi:hypothetical protein